MALGGGTFTSQNKVLPGAYINIKTASGSVVTIGERGTVALPIALSWGKTGVYAVTAEEFQNNSIGVFGYPFTAAEMQSLREVFMNAQKVLVYNLNEGGKAASATVSSMTALGAFCVAKCNGKRGNDMRLVITANIDDENKADVSIYMDKTCVFSQTVTDASELAENDFVTWNKEITFVKSYSTASTPFTGGTDGTASTGTHQNALNALESYKFDILVCSDTAQNALYAAYTERLRDKRGIKFQMVGVDVEADYKGIVSLVSEQANALYWTAGALAGCAVNKSCTNKIYNGELTIATPHTQLELENCILTGKFVFHKVDDEVRVLMDINTHVTYTEENGKLFSKNQVVRATDNRHNDIKRIFYNKYLGNVQNDDDGRSSFWGDVVKLTNEYVAMRAFGTYDSKSLTVELGDNLDSVVTKDYVTPIGTMEKLYMETICG